VAIPPGEDPHSVALQVGRARERFMLSRVAPSCVRSVVAASWQRCALSGWGLERRLPPIRLDDAALAEYRSGHPLAVLLPMLRDLLGEPAGDRGHLFAVTDATGMLLWVEGPAATLNRAARMNFVAGASWSEPDAGTNAPGTALATVRPVQIVATEHYNTLVHPWSCTAAPVRDPASGQVLGVVDVTGGESVASPYALAVVRAAARAAEAELARRAGTAGGQALRGLGLTGPAAPGTIRLATLGRDNALAELGRHTVRLSPRHSEIAVILALSPGGLSGPRLAVKLSEAEIHPVTLRAEMCRLRAQLGDEVLGSHPYRFRLPVALDLTRVLDLLDMGRVADAVAAYTGPLLPCSEAPAIAECRAALERELRAAVLASGDAAVLRRWLNCDWGADDIDAWQALAGAGHATVRQPRPS
jgi:hypothetical protein